MSYFSYEMSGAKLWKIWSYLAIRDLRDRYSRTKLGISWVILSLLIWSAGIGLVYGALFTIDRAQFIPYLATGFVCWTLLTGSLLDGASAFTSAEGYIKQFNLPHSVYLLRVTMRNLIIFALGITVPIALMFIFRLPISFATLFVIPAMFLLALVAHAHIVLSAHINLVARDFVHALTSALQLLFLITPIVFQAEILKGRGIDWVFQGNPFYHLLQLVRVPLLQGQLPSTLTLAFAGAYLIVVSLLAYYLRQRMHAKVVYLL